MAQHLQFASEPTWIDTLSIPAETNFNAYDTQSGFYSRLYSLQRNDLLKEEYIKTAVAITNRAGVQQASELYISYDSSYQTVDFHQLKIIRNGQEIDKTQDIDFKLLQQEEQLANSIYTGRITAYYPIEDVRVGDILEYSYTTKGTNPIFADYRYHMLPIVASNPCDIYHIKIVPDATYPYQVQMKGLAEEALQVAKDGRGKVASYTMVQRNIPAFEPEETVPSWYFPFDYLALTNATSWKGIAAWANGVFDIPVGDMNGILQDIFLGQQAADLLDSINVAINFIQDEIRYLGMENGIGSIQPFAPEQVMKQRFGDCKDKSLLLTKVLEAMGVKKAGPALVNTQKAHELHTMLPGPQVFNHCITWFELMGELYWIDPTQAQQGGNFTNKYLPKFGKALRLNCNDIGLTDIEASDVASKTKVHETIDASDLNSGASFTVTTKFTGYYADLFRNIFSYYSPRDISENFRQSYARLYSNIVSTSNIKMEDNRDQNELTVYESYAIAQPWELIETERGKIKRMRYEPLTLYEVFHQLDCEEKEYPVGLPYPSDVSLITEIKLPKKIPSNPEVKRMDEDAFSFSYFGRMGTDNTLKLTYNYKTKKQELTKTAFQDLCPQINAEVRDIPLVVYYGVED